MDPHAALRDIATDLKAARDHRSAKEFEEADELMTDVTDRLLGLTNYLLASSEWVVTRETLDRLRGLL